MDNKYKPLPFWSWNDNLDEEELARQVQWMHDNGIGGFFMHARGGLSTPYLGEKWFSCIDACLKKAKELNMEAYAYDENGWPSGFAGGELIKDPENCDKWVEYKKGPFDEKAVVAFDYSGPRIKKVTSGDDVLNIYIKTSNSTADICNTEVVRKFIDLTHEQYKKHDKYGNLRGFFTDEPQYYRWGTAFTKMLFPYFKEHYFEDVLDRIGLLFVEKEGYRDYRYKYWRAMQDLMLNNFAKQVYDWCDDNGYKLTGHYIEESLGYQVLCNGGVMPFYEYEHIPGVDHLCRPIGRTQYCRAKQLGSVVAQLGKEQAIVEEFALSGWDVTPIELKLIAERFLIDNITLVCHHLLPYSEHGQRKRDYPSHFSAINPMVESNFKEFNDTLTRSGEIITNSKEIVNVGLFVPIRSAYFHFKRELDPEDYGIQALDSAYEDINVKLARNGIQYHLLDETLMEKHGRVDGATLVVGQCRYKYIIIPALTETMDVYTMKLLHTYVSNGGKILLMGDVPQYLEGQPYNHDYLKSNITFEEIKKSQPVNMYHETVEISHRKDRDGKEFLYVVNFGQETDVDINIKGYKSFLDRDKVLSTHVHLLEAESKVLYPSNKEPDEVKKSEPLYLKKEYDIIGEPLNYLTIDLVEYSKDGVNFSKPLHYMCIQDRLLREQYKGDIYLRYHFDVKDIPSNCSALIEDTNTLEVKINGHIVKKNGTVLEKDLWSFDIAKYLVKGVNEIEVKLHYFQKESIYYALFGENVQESLRNIIAYDTTIEAIYLRGNFGVYGDMKDGVQKDVVIGENFYIGKQQKHVTCLIKDGYPFFRGNIKLHQDIVVDDVNKTLVFDDRFQLIDLYINNQHVKKMMFENKIEISKYLKKGHNDIVLELTVSNRNLLGPHHTRDEECLAVGPSTFGRMGTWKEDGSSFFYLPRYTFVKTII